ncbi:MAG: sigma-54-dependent Fis family transcriptional regulator [Gammaproteobacteria bacterium]|nr:sigma-54-dependent Fis family transcriptional regulator [Gammaproteobacteria bacterium]
MSKILIIDDDVASCRTLQVHLNSQGYEVSIAHSVGDGLQAAQNAPDLIILDIRMPGRSGLEGLPEFKQLLPDCRIIMITAFHDMESTIEAMQNGADDYIHKPIDIEELDNAISKLLINHRQNGDLLSASSSNPGTLTMVGRSRGMKEVFKTIGMVAKSPATVLITGESGTGKELVARAIHNSSKTPDGPFVAINCAALVETLLESDMFGHEKGSFTGAVSKQDGKFTLAHDGTIFLDEVGEMSPSMQAKLLRVLQYKEFTPLGAKCAHKTNARIVTATNVNLAERVQSGMFREDLYYRLQVVNINLPPLRERKEDLIDLIQVLIGRINKELHRNVSHISRTALDALEKYDWPGNVRELENVLMKSIALSRGDTLSDDLLPTQLRQHKIAEKDNTKPLERCSLEEIEATHIARVLEATNWHKGKACETLGISRPRLRRMIKHYHLTIPEQFHHGEDDDENMSS